MGKYLYILTFTVHHKTEGSTRAVIERHIGTGVGQVEYCSIREMQIRFNCQLEITGVQ